jgi:hypothetical protein
LTTCEDVAHCSFPFGAWGERGALGDPSSGRARARTTPLVTHRAQEKHPQSVIVESLALAATARRVLRCLRCPNPTRGAAAESAGLPRRKAPRRVPY